MTKVIDPTTGAGDNYATSRGGKVHKGLEICGDNYLECK